MTLQSISNRLPINPLQPGSPPREHLLRQFWREASQRRQTAAHARIQLARAALTPANKTTETVRFSHD